ncbi:MAG TPA: 3-dehydroquinate synthase [Candidatus Binataceae bacterium]
MESFRVELGPLSHPVHVGAGILDSVGRLAHDAGLKAGRAAVVTDSNVGAIYAARALGSLKEAGFDAVLIEVAPGEASKSYAAVQLLYDRMTVAELDRHSTVFALGGGVVGDLAGFAAATFLRGIAVVQIPTTVVGQVDASLGGKTGINHRDAKNLIGAFHQPRMIVADVSTLRSMPDREFREGLAEVIKYGAIMDADMIGDLERGLDAILARAESRLEPIVARSLKHKAVVVSADEREGGLRKILNYGHTVGHALEASAGYGTYLHGEAVAIGMAAAGRLSSSYAGLDSGQRERIERLLGRAGLPVNLPAGWRGGGFTRALKLDKKRAGGEVEFVLLDRLGHAIVHDLSFDDIVAGIG